jgi:uncharacterized protein DUF6894
MDISHFLSRQSAVLAAISSTLNRQTVEGQRERAAKVSREAAQIARSAEARATVRGGCTYGRMALVSRSAAANVMSRFFFHICEGSKESYIDHLGEELPDCASAWRIPSEYAGESIRDLDGGLKLMSSGAWM